MVYGAHQKLHQNHLQPSHIPQYMCTHKKTEKRLHRSGVVTHHLFRRMLISSGCVHCAQNNGVSVQGHLMPRYSTVVSLIKDVYWDINKSAAVDVVILSAEELQQLIGSILTSPMDSLLWQPSWVARYSVLIKCRGVIKSKGYIMHATRDIKQRPYIPSFSSAANTL